MSQRQGAAILCCSQSCQCHVCTKRSRVLAEAFFAALSLKSRLQTIEVSGRIRDAQPKYLGGGWPGKNTGVRNNDREGAQTGGGAFGGGRYARNIRRQY